MTAHRNARTSSPHARQPLGSVVVAFVSALALIAVPLAPLPGYAAKARRKPAASNETRLTISSLTRGATVLVDDEEVGTVPLEGPLAVTPNDNHIIRVQKRGFSTFVETVKLAPGENREIEADLVASGGILKVTANVRRATILLGGKAIGVVPFDGDVEPGRHQLQVAAPGKVADTRVIDIKAGEEMTVDVQLKDVPAPVVQQDRSILGRWWFWTAIGTAVVGGVAAGVFASREVKVDAPAPNHSILLP